MPNQFEQIRDLLIENRDLLQEVSGPKRSEDEPIVDGQVESSAEIQATHGLTVQDAAKLAEASAKGRVGTRLRVDSIDEGSPSAKCVGIDGSYNYTNYFPLQRWAPVLMDSVGDKPGPEITALLQGSLTNLKFIFEDVTLDASNKMTVYLALRIEQ